MKCRFIFDNLITNENMLTVSSLRSGMVTTAKKEGAGSATMTPSGSFSGAADLEYTVEIDSIAAGAEVGQATFRWSDGGGAWDGSGITTLATNILLNKDVYVKWPTGNFVVGDKWQFKGINLFNPAKMIDLDRDKVYRSAGLVSDYELLTVGILPSPAVWVAGDTLTGAISGATCTVVERLTDTTYLISGRVGTFGEYEAISITAGAAASIVVADDDDIDMETNNFAPYFNGLVPDFTPAANVILMQKMTGGVGFQLEIVAITGIIRLTLNATVYDSSVAPVAVDGTHHKILPAVTVGAVNTTVDFYFDGIALGAQQTAANPGTVSNAADLYILGTSAVRTAGTVSDSGILNFAPSAAEVLDMYQNGIPASWKWGSQTELMPNQVDRDFSGASAWANVDLNAYDETGDLTITANAAGQYCTCPVASIPTTIGYKYRLKFDVANIVSTWIIKSFDGTQTIGTVSANGLQQAFEWVATTTGGVRIIAMADNSSGDFDNFTLTKLGATLALEPTGITVPDWQDSSTNNLDAAYPGAGSSIVDVQWGEKVSNGTDASYYVADYPTTGTAPVNVTVDLGSPQEIKALILYDHNLTVGATITIKGNTLNTGWGSPAWSEAVTWASGKILHYLSSAQTYQYWRLEIISPTNPDLYFDIGELYLGSYMELSNNYKEGFSKPIRLLSDSNITPYGVKRKRYYNQQREFTYGFWGLVTADFTLLEAMLDSITDKDSGIQKPIWFDDNPAIIGNFWLMDIEELPEQHTTTSWYETILKGEEVMKSV